MKLQKNAELNGQNHMCTKIRQVCFWGYKLWATCLQIREWGHPSAHSNFYCYCYFDHPPFPICILGLQSAIWTTSRSDMGWDGIGGMCGM